jgi:FMN phosphatase YigB (HAD superfamily)
MHAKCVVFDVDGTLVRLIPDVVLRRVYDIVSAYTTVDWETFLKLQSDTYSNWKAVRHGYPGRKRFIKLWSLFVQRLGIRDPAPDSLAYVIQCEVEKTRDEIYPDASATIERLADHGYRLGILSERSEQGIDSALKNHGLNEFFGFRLSANGSPDAIGKRDPETWQKLISLAGCRASEICYVTDEYDNDISEAEKFGIRSILIQRAVQHMRVSSVRTITTLAELDGILIPPMLA